MKTGGTLCVAVERSEGDERTALKAAIAPIIATSRNFILEAPIVVPHLNEKA
jgi:hypothetical protein